MVVVKGDNPSECPDPRVHGENRLGVIRPVEISYRISISSAGAARAADNPGFQE